jgi:nitrogen regulatory protein P-II 1
LISELKYSKHLIIKNKKMKKIEAIIRTSKFNEVKESLHKIDIEFFSYWDATGVGNEKKMGERSYRGTVYNTEFISRRVLSIVVRDINLRKTVDCLLQSAYTGEVGDGKIFVSDIEESWRIRTKESGDDSLFVKD